MISLWIGRVIVGIVLIVISVLFLFFIVRPLITRAFYFIKRLLPPYWLTEEEWQKYKNRIEEATKDPNSWRANVWDGAKTYRKGQFGNLQLIKSPNWYNPKNHLCYIKKEKESK